jgi:hypothetical protein
MAATVTVRRRWRQSSRVTWDVGDASWWCGELVGDGGVPGEEVERKSHQNGGGGDGAEEEVRGPLKDEELGGIHAGSGAQSAV